MIPDGCGALGDALVLQDVEDGETGGRGGGGAGAGTTATAPAISAHDNGVTIVALNQDGYLSTSWWATNGTAGWVPSPMPDGDTSASSIVAYAGRVYAVARELSATWASVPASATAAPGRPAK
jgi:hypothetical protein